MRLALYQPDIPQNLGTLLRLAACMGVTVDIIEPCGFPLDDKKLKRAGMDYIDHVAIMRHVSFDKFQMWHGGIERKPRLILLTTKSDMAYTNFCFMPEDILMVGRETVGVPSDVHGYADARITIPMRPPMRSLNVAVAAAMVLGEALRQTQASF